MFIYIYVFVCVLDLNCVNRIIYRNSNVENIGCYIILQWFFGSNFLFNEILHKTLYFY